MAKDKSTKIELPVPVRLNGVTYEGTVEVSAELAEELQRISAEGAANGVALEVVEE